MAEVLLSPSHIPSSSSSSFSPGGGGELSSSPAGRKGRRRSGGGGGSGGGREKVEEDQLSLLTLLVAAVRKSLVGCRKDGGDELQSMEIGGPTNVRHLVHVTFDRFHGFLGLPVELEPEVPRRPPSASASVFGVSTESMQCSYDPRGNSVPTILLLMQRRLYEHGGLQAEGIFRINAENSQEEHVRGQLNSGIVPDDIDVHCLAGLIKAWFRELPSGVLDPLTPEQVMASQTEDDCAALAKLLPPPQAALLDWAVNLMADVAQHELHNKMNARNVAMVFAPNMTQMADPLTALMYAVQVMNLLKTLILRTLRERQEAVPTAAAAALPSGPSDEDDQNGAHLPIEGASAHEGGQSEPACSPDEAVLEKKKKKKPRRTSLNPRKGAKKTTGQAAAAAAAATTTLLTKKSKEATTSIVSRINPRIERAEAWR